MKKLTFTGDVMIGRLVNDYLKVTQDFSSIWGNTIETLKSSDLLFINLECSLTKNKIRGNKDSPVFFFRSELENVESLKEAGVNYCSLANNHTLDFGIDGLLETLRTLKDAEIVYAGAGKKIKEAKNGADLRRGDLKIKIFSFTDNEPGWEARKDKPGTFYLPIDVNDKRAKELFKNIQKAKQEKYFIIISAHWGPNMVRVPPSNHRSFAHKLIDSGCDIFHGHSSHVFQPIEIYKERVIFYDCGEMIDDYAIDPFLRNDESFIFEVLIDEEKIKNVVLIPILISNLQVNIVKGNKAENICSKMINLSQKFGTKAEFKKDKLEIKVN